MLLSGLPSGGALQRSGLHLRPALCRTVIPKPPLSQTHQPISSILPPVASWLLRSSADGSAETASTSTAEVPKTAAAAGRAARDQAIAAGVTDKAELQRVYMRAYQSMPRAEQPPPSPSAAAAKAAVEAAKAAGVTDKAELERVYDRVRKAAVRRERGVQPRAPPSPAADAAKAAVEAAKAAGVTDKAERHRIYCRARAAALR